MNRRATALAASLTLAALAALGAALTVLPGAAWAHSGHGAFQGQLGGTAAGLAHPLLGLDHLLAMVGVGLWATRLGGRAVWAVPLAFLAAMTLGGGAAFAGLALPGLELGIAGSVVLLGLLIASAVALPTAAAMTVVAAFALFHGVAHGLEAPAAASPAGYLAGFLLATAALHALGVGLGLAVARVAESRHLTRVAGGGLALAGTWLLVA